MSNDPNQPPSPPQPAGQPQPRMPSGQQPQRLPTGQHPHPPQRMPTGQSRLPTGQNRLPTGQQRLPTGQYRHPSGGQRLPHQQPSYPEAGYYAHPPLPPRKRADFTLPIILVFIIGGAAVLFLVTRDHWESDNKPFILSLKREAEMARNTQKKLAFEKYNEIVKTLDGRTLSDQQLKDALIDAKRQRIAINDELVAGGAGGTANAGNEKQADAAAADLYSKYSAKSKPLFDALMMAKADVEAQQSQEKYSNDVKEVVLQYTRWENDINNEEARYHSARLFKVARDAFNTGGSWWMIESEKKMPDALYAKYMRENEWAKANSALQRIKSLMENKDVMERKTCGPCVGTGKVKCPICQGSGICAFCKGAGNPTLKCCINGVCNACNGIRKEETCPICNGSGFFPPK